MTGRKIKRGLMLAGTGLLMAGFTHTWAQTSQTVNAGAPVAQVNLPGTGCTYNWTNDHPEIGLAASGTGNIPSFTAINNGTSPITATITVTPNPSQMAYVAGYSGVSVINTSTDVFLKNIPNGGGTTLAVANNSDGSRVYVSTERNPGRLSVINTFTNTIIKNIDLTGVPLMPVVSPDNKRVYVGLTGPVTTGIEVIDATNNTYIGKLLPAETTGFKGMVISPDGHYLYAMSLAYLWIIDLTTQTLANKITLSQSVNEDWMVMSKDGSKLYMGDGVGNNLYVLSTANGSIIHKQTIAGQPFSTCLSPDGQSLYVACYQSTDITVVNTTDYSTSTIPVGEAGYLGISITADGKKLYLAGNHNYAAVIDIASKTVINKPQAAQGASYGNFIIPGVACSNPVTYTIKVNQAGAAATPVIAPTGTPTARATVYGDPSAATSFKVSASDLTAAVLVTPPSGFEVSTDGANFSPTVSIANTGTLDSYIVYIRLAAITDVGSYQGNITLSSAGAVDATVAMPLSTVTKAPLTIAAYDVHKLYGDILSDMTGTGVYHVTAGALKNGNTLNTVTIIYGNGAQATAQAGTYTGSAHPQAATGNNGFKATNYDITYKDADIIIDKAPLTIRVNDRTKVYGTTIVPPPGTNFMTTGLRNNELATSITVVYSTAAAASTKVGTYPDAIISSNAQGNNFNPDNYDITYVAASIIVTPAQLSITADNKTRAYGASNPVLTATFTGFVNGETRAVLTTQPTISTTANSISPAGQYPITVLGALADNYVIIYTDGTLTISGTPPPPVVALVIPNTFTPNGDGVNDQWLLPSDYITPNCQVSIFNRLGARVFYSQGYAIPWDGTFNAQLLPVGTYYYIIDPKNGGLVQAGSVTIVR